MTATKLCMITYFMGAAVFALALLVVVLALVGVETVGKSFDLGVLIVGGFLLMIGSKFAAAAATRKAEKQ